MKYHADPNCYCEKCCDTATEWWEWRSIDGETASGSRYWTKDHALADQGAARSDGLPVLRQTQ